MVQVLGSDERIVQAARVSYGRRSSDYSEERNIRLLRYLYEHKHMSPFEHCIIAVPEEKEKWLEKFGSFYKPNLLWYWSNGYSFISLRQLIEFPDLLSIYPYGEVLKERFPAVYSLILGIVPDRMSRSGSESIRTETVVLHGKEFKVGLVDSLVLGTEMDYFTFYVECPIFVARQWMRHRFGSFNEFSLRYSTVNDSDVLVISEFRRQHTKNKQASTEETVNSPILPGLVDHVVGISVSVYKLLLEFGVAREIARGILPLGTVTRFYWTVPRLSLKNFLDLRLKENAQKEIRLYATAIRRLTGI